MIDKINLQNNKMKAVGRVCVELKDKDGKVIEKVNGNNHVFADSFFAQDWYTNLVGATLCLTDDTSAIDTDFPLLKGNLIGYGHPNTTGTGEYLGNWDSVQSYLRKQTTTGFTSKFVYNFASTQANGDIGCIGLSQQYYKGIGSSSNWSSQKSYPLNHHGHYPVKVNVTSGVSAPDNCNSIVQDPKNSSCEYAILMAAHSSVTGFSNAVIAKHNLLTGEVIYLDVLPQYSTNQNYMGIYIDGDDYYYYYNRTLYKYTTGFASLIETYDLTPLIPIAYGEGSTVVNGVFYANTYASPYTMYKVDLKKETLTAQEITEFDYSDMGGGYYGEISPTGRYSYFYNTPVSNVKVFASGSTSTYANYIIIDMLNLKVLGYYNADLLGWGVFKSITGDNSKQFINYRSMLSTSGSRVSYSNINNIGALTSYHLPTVIKKTPEHAMTITYEIEVTW